MTPAILWALVALNGSTFDVEVGYTTAGECAFHVTQFLRPSSGMKAVRRIQSWSQRQDYLNPLRPDVPAVCKPLAIPEGCDAAVSSKKAKAEARSSCSVTAAAASVRRSTGRWQRRPFSEPLRIRNWSTKARYRGVWAPL
jgi:hypothetical protein